MDEASWSLLLVVALRVLPAALVSPVLGGWLAPWSARLVLAGLVTLALTAVQPPATATAVAALPGVALAALAVKELAVGAALAAVVAVPFAVAATAGRWWATLAGLPGASPGHRLAGTVTGLLAVCVFFAIGGHLVAVTALTGSYATLPLLEGNALPAVGLTAVAGLGAAAVALAAPALVVGALAELALGLASRRTPLSSGPAEALRGAAVVAFVAASLAIVATAMADGQRAALRALAAALAR